MSHLGPLFAGCAAQQRAALVGYLPVGYPDPCGSPDMFRAMVDGGCDIVEVGIPYSDPMMDGPTIQAAAEQALRRGTRVRDVFRAVETVAGMGGAPVVMTYWNPILKYGVSGFARDLAAAGGLGLITPDLIPDEADAWTRVSETQGLDRIFLVAPSSTEERLAVTTRACRGFVYAASIMGVTGARNEVSSAAPELVARIRRVSDLPVGVGLGVRSGGQAAEIARYADGVIVGSALVTAASTGTTAVRELTEDLARGVRSPGGGNVSIAARYE